MMNKLHIYRQYILIILGSAAFCFFNTVNAQDDAYSRQEKFGQNFEVFDSEISENTLSGAKATTISDISTFEMVSGGNINHMKRDIVRGDQQMHRENQDLSELLFNRLLGAPKNYGDAYGTTTAEPATNAPPAQQTGVSETDAAIRHGRVTKFTAEDTSQTARSKWAKTTPSSSRLFQARSVDNFNQLKATRTVYRSPW